MSTGPFADFQNEVYLKGLLGELPTLPFGWREVEAAAHAVMSPGAVGYVAGGAGAEDTMAANRAAFDRWRLVPRMLRGVPGPLSDTGGPVDPFDPTGLPTGMAAPSPAP